MMRRSGAALAALLFGLAGQGLAAAPEKPAAVLVWSPAVRQDRLRHMETIFPHARVAAGKPARPFARGKPLTIAPPEGLEALLAADRTAGLIVLQDGRVRFERYREAFTPAGHWAGFSVTKSVTSTLYAIALRDGAIHDLDDPITRYLPEMKGSAYDGVTIANLLTMSSGVKWNEDYTDPKSDVARMYSTPADPGLDPIVSYMRKLPREAPPGTKWSYKTGETDLAGILLVRATGEPLAQYLSEKVWRPLGMAHDGVWMIDEQGYSPGGCCLSAALRDYARFGEFIRVGGRIGGKALLPADWLPQATTRRIDIGRPGHGYGYFWWTNDDGSYDAKGIFGQTIHIDPARHLVIVALAAWDAAYDAPHAERRERLIQAIAAAVDRDPGR